MSFLFFLDESGHDHRESPYEVRSAVAVHDSQLWELVVALKSAEMDHFGVAYSGPGRELKAKRLLKRKTFRLAAQMDPLDPSERRALAYEALVMDEMDQAEAHQLSGQMSSYFQRTAFGRARCRRIVPQPFFVHSDLTTGVQIADLVAYTLSWNVRLPGMSREARLELDPLGDLIRAEHRQYRVPGLSYSVSSFVYLEDLRTRSEKDLESREKLTVETEAPKPGILLTGPS